MVLDFQFDGEKLSDYGYMIGSFNGRTEDTVEVSVMDYTDIKSALSDVSHKVATSYPSNYTATVQIMKTNCDGDDDGRLSNDDVSMITKWLVRKEYKQFNWIYEDDTAEDIFYDVHCKISKITVGGDCYGLEVTFESNRPFGYTEIKRHIENNCPANYPIEVEIETEEEGWMYPDVIIKLRSVATNPIVIKNTLEPSRETRIDDCIAGEILTFHGGDLLQLTSSVSSHVLATDFNYVFPRLYNEYQMTWLNTFLVNAQCDITIQYRGIRKVGLGL